MRTVSQRLMEFPPVVRVYESLLWRRNPLLALVTGTTFAAELRTLLAATAPTEDAKVLDVACGPGIYTRPLARRAARGLAVGLDLSEPMIRRAALLATDEGVRNAVFVRGSALALPFAAGRFDVVNCCGALHLFPDVPAALAEMRRVLAPGGRLGLAVFRQPLPWAPACLDGIRRRVVGLVPFRPDDLERKLHTAGFAGVELCHQGPAWMVVSARCTSATASP